MLDARQPVAHGRTITIQSIRNDDARHIGRAL
jgi:hypothetical protein